MSDKVVLSRSNGLNAGNEEGARNDFGGGGLVSGSKPPFRRFKSWGRDFFASKTNLRPKGDAWRLRWWYHGAVILNHRALGKFCPHVKCHTVWGVLPLAVGKRWTDRSGERLDYFLLETLPGDQS